MGSGRYTDHDKLVGQIHAMAAAESTSRRDKDLDKKGYSHIERAQEASCFNCKLAGKCVEFRSKRTGSSTGAASFGGDQKLYCDKYVAAPAKESGIMPQKKVNSLLKSFKHFR